MINLTAFLIVAGASLLAAAVVVSLYSLGLRLLTSAGRIPMVDPAEFTVTSGNSFPADWTAELPEPQTLPADLVAEGHTIPVARVQAMHEGKRRKKAHRDAAGEQDQATSGGDG